jgi:hypothetical protein
MPAPALSVPHLTVFGKADIILIKADRGCAYE